MQHETAAVLRARPRRSKSAISLLVYAVYLGTGGLIMGLAPDRLTALLHVRPSDGLWIRIAGCLAFVLAIKGAYGAVHEQGGNMQLDVYTRSGFASFLTLLVLVGTAQPPYLLLAAGDFAASLWTSWPCGRIRLDGFPSQANSNLTPFSHAVLPQDPEERDMGHDQSRHDECRHEVHRAQLIVQDPDPEGDRRCDRQVDKTDTIGQPDQ